MDPQLPQKPHLPAPGNRRRTVIIASIALLIALIVSVVLLLRYDSPDRTNKTSKTPTATKEFQTAYANKTPSYAGSEVYDACGLVTLDTVKAHVNNYAKLLAKTGTESRPAGDPLSIAHSYIDRDIPSVLGKDGQPRPMGSSISQDTGGIVVSAFTSAFDSNCAYGQGEPLSSSFKGFARVYVTQKPTPLSPEFLDYVSTIAPQHKKQLSGFEAYTSTTKDRDGYVNAIILRPDKSLAVILRVVTPELLDAAVEETAEKLAAAPKGPVTILYPAPYKRLVNPCTLLSVQQFEQFTGKPASALAQEKLFLTEVNDLLNFAEDGHPGVLRECQRLEVDRSTPDNIAQTRITIRQLRSNASAKQYVQALKKDDIDPLDIKPLKARIQLGDEAYIKIDDQPAGGESAYEFEIRVGAAIIALHAEGDALSDASADAYEARMLPVAKAVLENYRKE